MKIVLTVCSLLVYVLTFAQNAPDAQRFRAPSVPLVTHDPYFSIWSPGNNLNDCETVHWTGKTQPLHAIVRIDGNSYRVMGSQPSELEPIQQTGVEIFPTRTIYRFQNNLVSLDMTFVTPALPSDLDILSRPVTYINWDIRSLDGKEHSVQLYFDCGGEIAVNTPDQTVNWSAPVVNGLSTLKLGSSEQAVLAKKGDDLRIDWGFAWLAIPENQKASMLVGERKKLFSGFVQNGTLQATTDLVQPRKVSEGKVTMASSWDLGKVGNKKVSSLALLAYDDVFSILYFESKLHAYWKRNGTTIEQLLPLALHDFPKLSAQCVAFDKELTKDLANAGGSKYATMTSLVYRQCLAAHKLVADENGQPLVFAKENFSNGCIATVDVIYPASPFFFLFSPALTKAMLQPIFAYSRSARWKFPFAPHDLGTYPFATGQAYGGGEKTEENQMPVEETGNMVIMTAVLAKMEGNADFAKENWPVLEKWCEYLLAKGFDPENQLCTDDFAGHLAHNINLSAKAIEALGCYSLLCEMTGRKEKAVEIRKKAEMMAAEWIKQAGEGDHTKLAYDRPGTWSQKYNLVWDKLLGLNLFPKEVLQKEIAYYQKIQSAYGLPLDNRQRYTKNDWITWTATMADSKEGFQAIFDPVWKFANATPQRVPVSDWYIIDNAYMVGFQARSVVGGFFIKMLSDQKIWNKWIKNGTNVSGSWAPLKFQ
ncbi:MAG: DUF4965 domain-containing protein [Prolixibacteraceae bacterium]